MITMNGKNKRVACGFAMVLWATIFCSLFASSSSVDNEWGRVVSRSVDPSHGTVFEKIMIYPFKDSHTSDRLRRRGFIIRHPHARGTILISHGFMCDKYYAGSLQHLFPYQNYNVVVFDFRAHGDDVDGQFCTFGKQEAHEVVAAVNFIRRHPDLNMKPLYAYGFSMGAVAAIQAQALHGDLFAGMILDCPFDSSGNLMKKGLKKFKISIMGYEFDVPCVGWLENHLFHPYVQMLVKYAFKSIDTLETKNIQTNIMPVDSVEALKKITVPCFFIHCKKDQHISVETMRDLYKAAGGKKRLWITNGRGHFDSVFYHPVEYSNKLKNFLQEIEANDFKDDQIVWEDTDEMLSDDGAQK